MIITGACGHLGSALIHKLAPTGLDLTLIDNLSTHKQCSLFGLPGEWNFIESDVRKVPAEVFYGQTVVHLAAIAEPQTSLEKPDFVMEHNCSVTAHIVNAQPGCLIFASSAGVYGPQHPSEFVFNPQTAYAEGKLKDEYLIRAAVEDYTILRFGTLFGVSPGMRFHTAVNKFCWQAATRQPITVWEGAMHQTRPYLHVQDAVHTIIHPQEGVFDVATCHATVAEVLSWLENYVRIDVKTIPSPPMDQGSYEIDCKLPMMATLEGGIEETMRLLLNA